MPRRLNRDDLEAAILSGLFLSAGGSGAKASARHRRIGELALATGPVDLYGMDEIGDGEDIIVATGVGAPGYASAAPQPEDSVDSARALIAMLDRPPTAVAPGHVPGMYAWLAAAALGLKLADTAGNGRGHPTVKMGAMGMASKPEMEIVQVGTGGDGATGDRLTVSARGNIMRTSDLMHKAASVFGGLVMAARGPVSAGFAREFGASGAVAFQLDLGRAMLATAPGPDRIQATADFLKGRVLAVGAVTDNDVAYAAGFDLGRIVVAGDGGDVALGVYNEYMTARRGGVRVATFPDMIGTLDAETGAPVAISELTPGARCAVVVASKRNFPLGAGALDPAVYPEVEAAMGVDLQTHALDPDA